MLSRPVPPMQVDNNVIFTRTLVLGDEGRGARDYILHLLAETDEQGDHRYELRDIVVLCADLPTYAPLIESVFAGDDHYGVAAILDRRPIGRRREPVGAGRCRATANAGWRFRASDVIDLINQVPVAPTSGSMPMRRDERGALRVANMRWGVDEADQLTAGIAALEVHIPRRARTTPRSATSLVLIRRRPVLGVAPATALPLDDVAVIGALGEVFEALQCCATTSSTIARLASGALLLLEVLTKLVGEADPDTWFQRRGDRSGHHRARRLRRRPLLAVPTADLVALLDGALRSSPTPSIRHRPRDRVVAHLWNGAFLIGLSVCSASTKPTNSADSVGPTISL